jgi:hypothetical protein
MNTAQATNCSLEEILLHVLQVGSPPSWDDIPAEFQADCIALDKLPNNILQKIAKSHKTEAEMSRYNELLEKNTNDHLTETEKIELFNLKTEFDRFMLVKAHAACLLRWRGNSFIFKQLFVG